MGGNHYIDHTEDTVEHTVGLPDLSGAPPRLRSGIYRRWRYLASDSSPGLDTERDCIKGYHLLRSNNAGKRESEERESEVRSALSCP